MHAHTTEDARKVNSPKPNLRVRVRVRVRVSIGVPA
jgi:hypothetical protein